MAVLAKMVTYDMALMAHAKARVTLLSTEPNVICYVTDSNSRVVMLVKTSTKSNI